MDYYMKRVETHGFFETWEDVLRIATADDVKDFSKFYEAGLAVENKHDKKRNGVYFTPEDVAGMMGHWFSLMNGENVSDVGCGVGNLVLAFLKVIGTEKARELILGDRLFLYDRSMLALRICKRSICLLYGEDLNEHIRVVHGDFLDRDIHLPKNCKVLSNPPYFRIEAVSERWNVTEVMNDSKELYAAFMEKIMDEAVGSIILTPQSFLGGKKFLSLRKKMSEHHCSIFAFDNEPGTIFIGRKQGMFTPHGNKNYVRAAITRCDGTDDNFKGCNVSGMIRFHNKERGELFGGYGQVGRFLGSSLQKVDDTNTKFAKCFPDLEWVLEKLNRRAVKFGTLLSEDGEFKMCVPNTCRYFTVASLVDLKRDGKYTLSFKMREERDLMYCWVNSSFCYWHWRLYDGTIVYQLGLLKDMPVVVDFKEGNKTRLLEIAKEMQSKEGQCMRLNKMRGVPQENILFPETYRNEINAIILEELGIQSESDLFYIVHSNSIFG